MVTVTLCFEPFINLTAQSLLAWISCYKIYRDIAASTAFIHVVSLVMVEPFLYFFSTNPRNVFVIGTEISVLGSAEVLWVEFAAIRNRVKPLPIVSEETTKKMRNPGK